MRIIAGQFRGRNLLAPASDKTRPITDRVKQSLFDMIAGDLPDAVVYDCFAGTGSMGLESLSRGSKLAFFFEADRSALSLLKQNIAALQVESQARIIRGDLLKWFAHAAVAPQDQPTVIFLDPPYRFITQRSDDIGALIATMAQKHLVSGGYIVLRHDIRDRLALPSKTEEFDCREYGNMILRLIRPTCAR
jgi:16S rRNA (guanine966-N2)-methyltransferase